MSRTRPGPREARHRLLAALTTLWCVLPLMLLTGPSAGAHPNIPPHEPTGVVATLSTDQPGLGGAIPRVLAQAGVTPITLRLTLQGGGDVFTQPAIFALDATLEHGTPAGTFTPDHVVLPAGDSTITATVTYSAVDNGVVLTPRLTNLTPDPFSVTAAAPFDSLKRVTTVQAGPQATSLGGDVCGRDSADVACATVSVPHGTASALATTTVGACTSAFECPAGSEVVGFIADLGTTYTRTAPAQITIRCDRSRCGNGGIKGYVVHMSFAASGPLDLVSRPCVAKGVADDGFGNDFCTDYVASRRDKGDLLLVVNVLHDYRGAV